MKELDDDIDVLLYQVWLKLEGVEEEKAAKIFLYASECAMAQQELRDQEKDEG